MGETTRVTAVVVTYNRQALLTRSLDALLNQTRPLDHILVVDNASTDETPSLFGKGSRYDNDAIQYLRLDHNSGGAGGFKEGLRRATEGGCDWCWIMDDDVVPLPDTLEQLLKAQEYLTQQDIEPSFLASYVSSEQGEVMNVPNVSKHLSTNGYPDWCEHLPAGLVRIESATFVSLLINAKAVREVGLPISDYFLWGDDGEYTTRLTSYYGPAFLCGASKALHLRAIARPISTVEETDASRVANQRRAIRNGLINTQYYKGSLSTLRKIARRAKECVQVIIRPTVLKQAKVKAISGGVVDFLAHRYDLEDLAKLDKRTIRHY